MSTYTFREVSVHADKAVNCTECGKRLRRKRKFSQTLNPWNRREDGRPKRRDDILPELKIEVEEWKQAPECCRACAP